MKDNFPAKVVQIHVKNAYILIISDKINVEFVLTKYKVQWVPITDIGFVPVSDVKSGKLLREK